MEINTVKKKISRVKCRVAYVYPSTYTSMISGLAPDIIYTLTNSYDDVYLERFVCKSLYGPEDEPRSLETGSRLREFPLILTSLHYELDIVNLVRLLLAGRVEVFSSRRSHVIVAGGPAVMSNPLPYSDVVDAFIIGEAEVTLPKILELWLEYRGEKRRFLEAISSLRYVYVPGYSHNTLLKEYVRDLDHAIYPVRQVENTEIEPVYGRGLKLEVNRGCLFRCSFCLESRVFQPYRERSLFRLKSIIEEGLKYSVSGKRLIIYSLCFPATRTHILLLEYLANEGFIVSLPSVRISSRLVESLELIRALGQRTLTIAPESFSGLAQSVFFKYTGFVDYILSFIRTLIDTGFDLKIYLIYGVKGLDSSIVHHDIEVLRSLAKYARAKSRRVSAALTPLIPKPHTVFQWIGMLSYEALASQLRLYKSSLRGLVEARLYDIDLGILQAQIALSPRPLGKLLVLWALYGGGLSGWRRAMRELTGEFNFKYVFSGYEFEKELPWGFIRLDEASERVTRIQYEVAKRFLKH